MRIYPNLCLLVLTAVAALLALAVTAHAQFAQLVVDEDFDGTGSFSSAGDVELAQINGLHNAGWSIDLPDTDAVSTITHNTTNNTIEVRNAPQEISALHFARASGVDASASGLRISHFAVFENFEMLNPNNNAAAPATFTFLTGAQADGSHLIISLAETDDGTDGNWLTSIIDQGFLIQQSVVNFTQGTHIAMGIREYADGTAEILYDEDTTDNGGVAEEKVHDTFTRFFNKHTDPTENSNYSFVINTIGEDTEVNYDLVSVDITTDVEFTPGDFDSDDDFDGQDFLIWQRNSGTIGTGTFDTGDANLDGDVNGVDLGIWQSGYTGGVLSAASSVPEPGALAIVLCTLVTAAGIRKHR